MAGFFNRKFLFQLLLLLITISVTGAGHPVWETSRVEKLEWVAYEDYGWGIRLWPEKKIRYCFENDEARNALGHIVRSAHTLWLNAGLPAEFKIEEVSLDECARNPETTMKIVREKDTLYSPAGLHRYPDGDNRDRPEAHWTEAADIAFFDPVSNIAHELGHVFGLIHEMQLRLYWNHHQNENEIFDWHCDRIQGYHQLVQEYHLSNDDIWDPLYGICTDANSAAHKNFQSFSWLPYTNWKLYYSPHRVNPTVHDVDWDSIMMYASYMGYPGGQDDHNFDKAVILKSTDILPEDRWIPRNMVPSALDIEGLKLLYGHKWPVPAPMLYGTAGSPYNMAFRRLAPGCYAS